MNKLSDKEKVEIGIIVIIIILAVYYEFIMTPIMSANSNMNHKITEENNKYTQMNILDNENTQFKTKIASLKKKYEISSNGIPTNAKDAEIQKSITDICSKNSTVISSITFADPILYTDNVNNSQTKAQTQNGTQSFSKNSLMKLPVIIIMTGSYPNIIKAISEIEKANRIFKITDFTLSNGSSTATNNGGSTGISSSVTAQGISATINGDYCFFNGKAKPKYDFNLGSYGKSDLFN